MKLTTVKEIFETKLAVTGGLKPPTTTQLQMIAHEAMVYVATKCKPRELLQDMKHDGIGAILRMVEGGRYVMMPELPDFTNTERHLQMDEDLVYAVLAKMMAIYAQDMREAQKYEEECTRIINIYKANFNRVGEA